MWRATVPYMCGLRVVVQVKDASCLQHQLVKLTVRLAGLLRETQERVVGIEVSCNDDGLPCGAVEKFFQVKSGTLRAVDVVER